MDAGHRQTEEYLAWLEKDLDALYSEAAKDLDAKWKDYIRRFEIKDETWRGWVKDGKKTQEEYNQWRMGQIAVGERWEAMRDTMAQDMVNADNIARKITGEYMPDVYAVNHNFATYEIEHQGRVNTSYTLYNHDTVETIIKDQPNLLPGPGKRATKQIEEAARIGKDLRWNRQQINNAVLQGIIQGEPIPAIAQRLEHVAEMDHNAAIRNARTAITGAQNLGRQHAFERATELGVEMEKEWIATLDNRTRHSHRALDGETVSVNDTFSNNLEYPGDTSGDPSEVYNCRCTMKSVVKGWESKSSQVRGYDAISGMSYDEWLEATPKSNPITLPEEKSEAIRQSYIAEYRRK